MTNDELLEWARAGFEHYQDDLYARLKFAAVLAMCLQTKALTEQREQTSTP